MELLKDEADGFSADMVESEALSWLHFVRQPDLAAGGAVEASNEIDHGALARTEGPIIATHSPDTMERVMSSSALITFRPPLFSSILAG